MATAGYNISLGNLGHRYEEALTNAAASGADFHLLMTNPHNGINGAGEINEIQRWKDAMPAGTRLVWRTFIETNGEWIRTLGFKTLDDMLKLSDEAYQVWCDEWAKGLALRWENEGHKDVIRDDPDNEPKLAGASEKTVRRYVISRVALVKACKARGIPIAIGAFAVGLPNENMIDRGIFDPLLKIVEIFSVHEYPPGAPGIGDVLPYEVMLSPELIWQMLPKQVWAIGHFYWLMRRCDRLKLRGDEVGNPNIKFIITETSTNEDIPDASRITSQLRSKYSKAECGGDLRGVQAWTKYHADIFGANDANQNVAKLIEYMLTYIYNVPHVIGVCFFSLNFKWGTGSEGKFRCHNFLNEMFDLLRRTLIPEINSRMRKDNAVAIPNLPADFDWKMRAATISSTGVNVRAAWSAHADVEKLFVLKDEQTALVSENTFPNEGYDWYRVKFDTGQVGYVVKKYANVVYAPVTVPDETQPIELPDGVSEDSLEAIVVKWLEATTDISPTAVEESVTTWLDEKADGIIQTWLNEHESDFALHVSAHLTDTPKVFDLVFARLLRQVATRIEEMYSPPNGVEASH